MLPPPRSTLFPYTTLFRSISDVGMPERDGYDFIQSVRSLPLARGRDVPAIALTAYARGEDRRKLLKDRKSTRLNSSHSQISYAVFCLKKKTRTTVSQPVRY